MPDEIDANETLRPYRGWLQKMASVYMNWNPDEWDDLAQEGYIEMWRALKTYDSSKGALPAWLTFKASLRMRSCAANLNWTGSPNRRQGRNKYKSVKPAYLTTEDLDLLTIQTLPDGLDLAYHQGQIHEALDGLSPAVRSALFKRFWLDQDIHKSKYRKALPKLQEKLGHLRNDYG